MFWLRNKKNDFQLRTFIWRPDIFYLFKCILVIIVIVLKIYDTNGTQTMILCVAECQLCVVMGYSMLPHLLNFNTDETQHVHIIYIVSLVTRIYHDSTF